MRHILEVVYECRDHFDLSANESIEFTALYSFFCSNISETKPPKKDKMVEALANTLRRMNLIEVSASNGKFITMGDVVAHPLPKKLITKARRRMKKGL